MRHGWGVVGATFIVLFVGFGAAYTFSTFFPSLEHEFGATRAETSLVFSLAAFLYFGFGAISGRIADIMGPRELCIAGMAVVGAGLLLAAHATTLWEVCVGYGLGVGFGVGLAYVPAVGAVQRWFTTNRGMASGFAVAGIGFGTLAAPLIAIILIEAVDWRFAYLAMAVGILILGGGAAHFITVPANGPAAGPALSGFTVGEALSSRIFWILYLATLVLAFGMFIPFVHAVPHALDQGFSLVEANALVPLIGVGSTVGRFLLAPIADRIGRKLCLALLYAGMGAMLGAWMLVVPFWQLAIVAGVFGLCYGGFVALAPSVTADLFGLRSISAIIGLLYSSVGIGTLLGPPLAGLAYDEFSSYEWPFFAVACLAVVAACVIAFIPTGGQRPPG
ncbi:MAG: MFS transporter [Alphaproteobacteria bacterium]|nr:MFS transporter [Alphaproteobacteria bacterium]